MRQPDTQEQVPRGHSTADGIGPQEVCPIGAGLCIIMNLEAELHFQLDLTSYIIFSGIFKSREHSTWEPGKSSNATEVKTWDLEPEPMPSTPWEPSLVLEPVDHG